MKRGIIGIVLLLGILCCGIAVTVAMNRIHEPLAAELNRAAAAAEAGSWPEAAQALEKAHTRWNTTRGLTAAVADHGPMEEIESTFAKAQVFLRRRNADGFAATCAELSRQVQAMGEAQSIGWQNLL
jgi:hypothetical protein